MGSGEKRNNIKRPATGAAGGGSGAAIVTCDVDTTARADFLSAVELPTSCEVALRGSEIVFVQGDRGIAKLIDRSLTERLGTCVARGHSYSAVLRRQDGHLVADISGG